MSTTPTSTSYAVHGPVAVVTLNNPPVNGLGHALRSGIVAALDQALAEDSEAAAEARVAAVAAQTWDRRVDDVLATVTQALARR